MRTIQNHAVISDGIFLFFVYARVIYLPTFVIYIVSPQAKTNTYIILYKINLIPCKYERQL